VRDVRDSGDSRLLSPRDRFRDPRRGDPALPRRLGEGHVQRGRGQRAEDVRRESVRGEARTRGQRAEGQRAANREAWGREG